MQKLHSKKSKGIPFLKFDLKMKLAALFTVAALFSIMANSRHVNTIRFDGSNLETTDKKPPQQAITGKVSDGNNQPLPGANIIEKGTTNGTQSDFDGNFSLTISNPNATLVISYVGFVSQDVAVNNRTNIQITLLESTDLLDEVVVIGYGTVKKRDLTGAVSSVKSEEIGMAPVISPIEAIQGRVAGLDITRNDGRSGSGFSILLRGNRSLLASSEPIYIIDGIQGSINNLNPNDIESIDVLKDASSTAIYGSAGANGVIIITTKKGKDGKIQVDFNSYISINGNPSYPSALQGDDWLEYLTEGFRANNNDAAPADRDALLSAWGLNTTYLNPYLNEGKYVDWVDETFKTGIQTNNTLSIRGGTEKIQASFSMGHNKTEGIYVGDNINVYTMRGDMNIQAGKWAKLGITTGLIYRDQNSNRSRVNRAFSEVPYGDPYDENGQINPNPIAGDSGTISILANNIPGTYLNNNKSINITANPYAEFTLAKGLTLRSILGVSLSNSRAGEFKSDHTYLMLTGSELAIRGGSYNTGFNYGYTWENIFDYNITIADHHALGATFITSYADNQSESSNSRSEGFISDNSLYFDLGAGPAQFVDTGYSMKKRSSYAGRINYSYRGKYLLTGSIRADGVSQLSDTKEWDVFPAGAIAWRISDENFMGGANWLSDLKLRAGYGVSGNSNIDAYASLDGVVTGQDRLDLGGGEVQTFVPSKTVSNDLLGWEKSYNLNIGLDFGFFKNRVYGAIEYYNTDTKDVIYERGLPSTVGGFGPKVTFVQNGNVAEMNNEGIELTLNTRNIQTENFQWTSNLTFARNWEKVVSVDLGNVAVDELRSLGLYIGSPKDVFYDYKKNGIWKLDEAADAAVFGVVPGDVKIESGLTRISEGVWIKTDDEGNETEYTAANPYAINANENRQILGHEVPDWTLGFQNTFVYKGFDLNIFATARYGQTIDGQLLGYFRHGNKNIPDTYDYWTPTNPTNDYPRPYITRTTNNNTSPPIGGLNFVDGSYFKIKNITLGYTLPGKFTTKIGLSDFRVYGTVYNALIITKSHLLDGVDPETSASDSFPLYKQTVLGINVSF